MPERHFPGNDPHNLWVVLNGIVDLDVGGSSPLSHPFGFRDGQGCPRKPYCGLWWFRFPPKGGTYGDVKNPVSRRQGLPPL